MGLWLWFYWEQSGGCRGWGLRRRDSRCFTVRGRLETIRRGHDLQEGVLCRGHPASTLVPRMSVLDRCIEQAKFKFSISLVDFSQSKLRSLDTSNNNIEGIII